MCDRMCGLGASDCYICIVQEGCISEGLESFNSLLNKYLAMCVDQTQYIYTRGVGGGQTIVMF